MKQIFFIKANASFVCLIQDISAVAKDTAVKGRKKVSELRFAQRTQYGYRFLKNKLPEKQILMEVTNRISRKYPQYSSSYLIDLISELVNITVHEAIIMQGKQAIAMQLPEREKKYLKQHLLSITDSGMYLPRHPWFMPLDGADGKMWKAKDITTRTDVIIQKMKRGQFYEYEITPSSFV